MLLFYVLVAILSLQYLQQPRKHLVYFQLVFLVVIVDLLTLFIVNLHVTKELSEFWNGERTE